MMQYKKPCYATKVDTFLAKDTIRPYGERFYVPDAKRRKEIALQLLSNVIEETESQGT